MDFYAHSIHKEWIKREEYLPNFFLENVSNAEKVCAGLSLLLTLPGHRIIN